MISITKIVQFVFVLVVGILVGGAFGITYHNTNSRTNIVLGEATIIEVSFHENGYKIKLETCNTATDCIQWEAVVDEPLLIGKKVSVEFVVIQDPLDSE